jgi:hypothetical protein
MAVFARGARCPYHRWGRNYRTGLPGWGRGSPSLPAGSPPDPPENIWSNRGMETRELTGGEAIVQGLLAHDIDTVVKVPRGSDGDPWKFIHPTFS